MITRDGRSVYCTRRQKIYYELKRISEGTKPLQRKKEVSHEKDTPPDVSISVSASLSPSSFEYQRFQLPAVDHCEINATDITELIQIQDLSPKLALTMRCIYCLLLTYFTLIIQPLLEDYYQSLSQQKNVLFRRTASSDYCVDEEPITPASRTLQRFDFPPDEFPTFWTITLLKKKKLFSFWIRFHDHLVSSSQQLKTCLQDFSWRLFCETVLIPTHPNEFALCLTVISKDQFFLQSSQLFPHAIYRALSRQMNCQLFTLPASASLSSQQQTHEQTRQRPHSSGHVQSLHLHSHLSQKMSQWLIFVVTRVREGLIKAGKSPDPMNRSLTAMSLSSASIESSSVGSPFRIVTPKHFPTVTKHMIFFLSSDCTLHSSASSRSSSLFPAFHPSCAHATEDGEARESTDDLEWCSHPKWLRHFRSIMSLCRPFDHLHILYPSDSSNSTSLPSLSPPHSVSQIESSCSSRIAKSGVSPHSAISTALQKYSSGNLPMHTIRELLPPSSPVVNLHSPIHPSPANSLTLFYQRHIIPYSRHLRHSPSSSQSRPPRSSLSNVLCSVIHRADPLPPSARTQESEEDALWTDTRSAMIETKTTRHCLQAILSSHLDVCVLPRQGPKVRSILSLSYVSLTLPLGMHRLRGLCH
jgi:hypothetical protein